MKVAGLDIDDILKMLGSIVEGEEKLSDSDVRKLLLKMYTELTGNFTPIIRGIPALSGPVSKDLAIVASAVYDVIGNVFSSSEYAKAHEKFAKARASLRMISMKAYENAGFTSEQAFLLVLQDAAQKLPTPSTSSSNSSSSKG